MACCRRLGWPAQRPQQAAEWHVRRCGTQASHGMHASCNGGAQTLNVTAFPLHRLPAAGWRARCASAPASAPADFSVQRAHPPAEPAAPHPPHACGPHKMSLRFAWASDDDDARQQAGAACRQQPSRDFRHKLPEEKFQMGSIDLGEQDEAWKLEAVGVHLWEASPSSCSDRSSGGSCCRDATLRRSTCDHAHSGEKSRHQGKRMSLAGTGNAAPAASAAAAAGV